MRLALDTNILAYAEGVNGAAMQNRAIDLLETLVDAEIVLPVQMLGELAAVLTRKAGRSKRAANTAILQWSDAYSLVETSSAVMINATDLAADHDLGLWDSVILAAAASAHCRLLLSQDFQDGFTWNGMTIADPFADQVQPLLRDCLEEAGSGRS